MPAVTLRPADARDWPMIDGWLRQPEVQRWWGSLATAQAEVMAAMRADMGLCSIIEAGHIAVGYAQALDTGPVTGVPHAVTAGTFRIDAFIANPAYRNKGAGQAAIQLVAAEIFSTTLAPAAIVIAALKHEAAVRAYEKSGFQWVRVIDDPLLGPSWLMRLERPKIGR